MTATRENLRFDLSSDMDIERVFQKHIVDGPTYYFSTLINDRDNEYNLRHAIATVLDVHINDTIIIGSSKLGFSVKTDRFHEFDRKYINTKRWQDRSDIDIAVVSRKLFDNNTALIYQISEHFSKNWISENWLHNKYYKDNDALTRNRIDSIMNAYTRYVAKGWLRVDLTPNLYIESIPYKEVQDHWSMTLDRKVNIAIYSDWYYLKHYQMDNLLQLRAKIKGLNITI